MKTIMMLPFLLVVFICDAQRFQISGTVLSGHQPVPGATVSVQNTNHSTVTDEKGIFTFTDLLPAEYKIQISSIGFFTVVQNAVHHKWEPTYTGATLHRFQKPGQRDDSVTCQNAFGSNAITRCGRNIHLCRKENGSGCAERPDRE